jgi:hypothetical protein
MRDIKSFALRKIGIIAVLATVITNNNLKRFKTK